MSLTIDEVLPEQPNGEVVHWMDPAPLRVGPGGLSVAVLGAFTLGVAAAFGAMAFARWFAPRREGLPPWRWGRGPLH